MGFFSGQGNDVVGRKDSPNNSCESREVADNVRQRDRIVKLQSCYMFKESCRQVQYPRSSYQSTHPALQLPHIHHTPIAAILSKTDLMPTNDMQLDIIARKLRHI